jgi:hypothetical protein
LHASKHSPREPRPEYQRRYNERHPRPPARDRIIGIDGEGQGRRPHRYNYLAAADELGQGWHVSAPDASGRLGTSQCLDFILGLPGRALIFGFAFLYDLTKVLEDIDDRTLYNLVREERRAYIREGRVHYKSVSWQGYKLNYINRCFSVSRGNRRATVWDVWRFFQGKFTTALIDWQIADKAKLERMARMKDLRSTLDQLPFQEVKEYCNEECAYLATLGRRLIAAHDNAGLKLKHYFGAGSTASTFLDNLGIREKRGEIPDLMRDAVACSFIGGRFENSCAGPIRQRVWNYDIASAYPYQATFLPCLQHGVWRLERSQSSLANAQLALIHWAIPSRYQADNGAHYQADNGGHYQADNQAWGVLPHRSKNGTIRWPLSCAGGWTWKEEFIAAQRLNPRVTFREAWVYETSCGCPAPFASVPDYYRERIKLGKDAAGIPIKLGLNSGTYGKLAQSTGLNPPYQSWVWAANVTSGCRAQLLDAIGVASDPWNILMFATDGVWSREKLSLPAPRDTGTGDLVKPSGASAALGCWEEKEFPDGVFCVRPGIYFPLRPSEDALKEVRARGLGKKVLYDQYPRVMKAWDQGDKAVTLGGRYCRTCWQEIPKGEECPDHDGKPTDPMSRFIGIKSGIHKSPGKGYVRSADYGEWIEWDVKVSFDPCPKRAEQVGERLRPWSWVPEESEPYSKALESPEGKMLKIAELIAEEQADVDWTSYE